MAKIAFWLLIIGGLNWLLVGLFKWDLVAYIFGDMDNTIARVIYILVGLSALVVLKGRRSSPSMGTM